MAPVLAGATDASSKGMQNFTQAELSNSAATSSGTVNKLPGSAGTCAVHRSAIPSARWLDVHAHSYTSMSDHQH